MIETILLARERKSGKQVVLMGSEIEFHVQKSKLHEFDPSVNDEFSSVGLYQLVAQKKVLRLMTSAEAKALADTTKKHNDIQAKAEADTVGIELGKTEPKQKSKKN